MLRQQNSSTTVFSKSLRIPALLGEFIGSNLKEEEERKSGLHALRSAALGLSILLLSLAAARVSAENVKVGIPSLTVTMMPLAVARERGFFQQEGLEQKPAVSPILRRFLRIEDEDLLSRIYDYHRRAETPDGRIDTALAAETIRDARLAEGVAKEIPVEQVFDFSYLTPLR